MKKRRVVDIVKDVAAPICDAQEIELVDVEFTKEGPHRFLRIIIDKDGGVSLDDCQKVSSEVNVILDKLDPIEENYFLEVTSPGVERELKRKEDFKKFKGKDIQINLFQPINGQKVIKGILIGLEDGDIKVLSEGMELQIPLNKTSLVKLVAEFNE